ncbi:ATP synthase protein I [Arthrobacter stackebrandtii]|uniref:ATP synthase protein I n=1 Tax=Arthrobacter stackebrandtii TaxID=272161 RepID=A0ABS4YYN2_9MICC|nr:hypothetical protein [Arthrobacter stackebrandtii]MBP2413888.1 ATP synthase protein I [Arthrobacter stackebrandtii]PYH00456.1 hypothetical protein CVV67_10170 [Arthrobacter stackebrandtii]
MKDNSALGGASNGHLPVSGPTESPSWNILKRCVAVVGLAVVAMAGAAFIFTDGAGVLSVLFGSALVVAFFGLSLLAGHLFARKKPEAVMGVFVMTYFVKVLGFGAVLFYLGTPGWLNKPWFAGAAVACVLIWQATEVVIFSKQRFLFFNEVQTPAKAAADPAAEPEGEGS